MLYNEVLIHNQVKMQYSNNKFLLWLSFYLSSFSVLLTLTAPPQSSGVFPWDLQLLGSPLFPLSPFTPLGLLHLPHFPSSHPTFNPGHWMILRVFSHLGNPAVFPSQGKQGIVFGVLSVGMMVSTSPRRMKSFPWRAFPKWNPFPTTIEHSDDPTARIWVPCNVPLL